MHLLELGGAWQLRQVGKEEAIKAYVPGSVHLDLMAAGKLPDPFWRDNEDFQRWVSEATWEYSRSFNVSEELLAEERVELVCEGLDTLATLFLNGQELGRADNMFRTWQFDVKAALKAWDNELVIRFDSPMPLIKQKQAEHPIPSWGGPKEINGRAWVRKEPCSFGWDWGPVLPSAGIWRPIRLVGWSNARLADVQIQQDHSKAGQVQLTVALGIEKVNSGAYQAEVSVTFEGQAVASGTVSFRGNQGKAKLVIEAPRLWWPNNLGDQPLYQVKVSLSERDTGQELDSTTKRIGLRTLKLDRHPDEWGESFQFVVNGVPFFAKGANWIPADSFINRMFRQRYADLLGSAAAANMNMLRLWGGGIYEQDDFYELADELGLCIWHDFIFACSTYPTFDEGFMANVGEEFRDNIKRLRHHPSIALWCGNNELEQGLVGDIWSGSQMSWEDYDKLFEQLLPKTIAELDPGRDYWPSSPHSTRDRRDFNDPTNGDAHLWDVWHGRKPFEWYRGCEHRFNSEFGFQSFPEPRTVYTYTEPQDRNVTTYVMEHHQRSGIGNTVIMQYMLDWFRLPTSFEATIWLSQILQGMAMKYAVEHWRRAMPRGMGTLYWQLNDCWPVASWSSIDYFGRWKALNHMAQDFYAPLLVSAVEDWDTGSVELHVTNDLREEKNGSVRWLLTDLRGAVLESGERKVTAPAGANTQVAKLELGRQLSMVGHRNALFWVELRVEGKRVSSNLALFARPKHLDLPQPSISLDLREDPSGGFMARLEADRPALWVWLTTTDAEARYSANFFHLRPGAPFEVLITPKEPLTLADLKHQLRVANLVDTYTTPL